MKIIDRPSGCFCDRTETNPELERIDVIMMTLDAETFLEKSLFTVYREIPVKRLIICDGGSKDSTYEILEKFPRVELHKKSEIKTGAKSLEFLMTQVESNWFVLVDADIELSHGWYDEMSKHQDKFDAIENGKNIMASHKYQLDEEKIQEGTRAGSQCHLMKKEAVKNFHCDDDYMWRHTDFLMQQIIEQSGFKYGKVNDTFHIHNETERIPYKSDTSKSYRKIVIDEPKYIIIDKEKAKKKDIENAKAIVKYLDPDFHLVKRYPGVDFVIRILDRKWIEENNASWLERYDNTKSLSSTIKNFIYKNIIQKNKRARSYALKKYQK